MRGELDYSTGTGYVCIPGRTNSYGRVMEKDCQDRVVCFTEKYLSGFIVCDGHGPAGKLIAETFINNLVVHLRRISPIDISNQLQSAVLKSTDSLYKSLPREVTKSGTTVCAVIKCKDRLYGIYVGDSPAFLINKDDVKPLINAHNFENMTELKRVEAFLRYKNDKRLPGGLNITRSIGDSEIRGAISTPEVFTCEYKSFDYLLVCSDGVSDVMDNKDILECLYPTQDPVCEDPVLDVVRVLSVTDCARKQWGKKDHIYIDDIAAILHILHE